MNQIKFKVEMRDFFKGESQNKLIDKNIGGEKMQNQKFLTRGYQTPVCANCGNKMRGFSANFHHYQCPNCNVRLQSVGVQATQGFEWIIAGVCILLIIGAIAELCS